jgi:hypothetical protein
MMLTHFWNSPTPRALLLHSKCKKNKFGKKNWGNFGIKEESTINLANFDKV